MAYSFANKTVVITGGTDGIGKALALQCLKLRANVSVCGRSVQKLQALEAEANESKNLLCLQADVANKNDCQTFITHTLGHFSGIDILINNAGLSMRAMFEDADVEVIEQLMQINFFGAVYCTKYAVKSIIERKGIIVGVSSIAGYRGLPGRSGYSASKFAMVGWLEALRSELYTKQVHVMWVSPGFTQSNIRNTALNAQAQSQGETPVDENKLMTADECAAHILQAIAHKKRSLVLTFTGKFTIFMNRVFPSLTDKLTRKFFMKDGTLNR